MGGKTVTITATAKDGSGKKASYKIYVKKGIVKKTAITDYANVRKTGLAAITLREDDELIEVKFTDDSQDIFLVTKYGQCIRFHESDVRCIGRTSMGVRGINLTGDDEVIGMQLDSQGDRICKWNG